MFLLRGVGGWVGVKRLLHLYSELKNEYISLRIKAADDETLLSAKSLDALHYRGSCNKYLKTNVSSFRRLRFSPDADIVRLTNARIIIIVIIILLP